MPVSRRDFVVAGLGLLTGCGGRQTSPGSGALSARSAAQTAVPSTAASAPPLPSYGKRVIIIGAGLAGLTAAWKLKGAGFEVSVLEATDRPGGRIHTLREPFSAGQFVEMGAAHLVGDPDLMQLVEVSGADRFSIKKLGGPTRSAILKDGKRTLFERGKEPALANKMSAAEAKLEFAEKLTHYFGAVKGKTPQELGWDSGLTELDNVSAADYLRAQGATPAFIRFIEEALVPGDSAEDSSALSIMRDAASFRREILLPRVMRIRGGMDQLPLGLSRLLGETIRYEAPVTRIRQGASGVRVGLLGSDLELEADQLICALPYSALSQLELPHNRADHPVPFYFSAEKSQAIKSARMATVMRMWVQTRTRFWLARGETGRVETDLALSAVRDETEQGGEPGILGAYLSGRLGRRFCGLKGDKLEAFVLPQFEAAQPGVEAGQIAFASKCWTSDPYARGAYSWFGVGELTRAGAKYASREERIHFAGDHVSSRPGFMHGAVESALRVVEEVKQLA